MIVHWNIVHQCLILLQMNQILVFFIGVSIMEYIQYHYLHQYLMRIMVH